jgi:3-dehydroquinate dehydratase
MRQQSKTLELWIGWRRSKGCDGGSKLPLKAGRRSIDKPQSHLDAFQSNHEGPLSIEFTKLAERLDTSYTHTSVAIRDALSGVGIPFIEVHKRESFRHHSYLSDKAESVICVYGYPTRLRSNSHVDR